MHRSIIRKTRRIVNTMRVSSLFLFFLCVHNCGALSLTGWLKRIPLASRFTTTGRNTASPIATTRITGTPPSWEALALSLQNNNESTVEPLVTLYRDTNGWCPFCERVWVALHVKQIPYQETLVSLQNKPQWYKQLVPTTLVPAVLFHGSSNDGDKDTKNERRIVWESMDILKALDDEFPDTPKVSTYQYYACLMM
jgi:glutaredoxin